MAQCPTWTWRKRCVKGHQELPCPGTAVRTDRYDAEMESVCVAFMAKWGKIPLLDTYRQMAVRQQKKKDW